MSTNQYLPKTLIKQQYTEIEDDASKIPLIN